MLKAERLKAECITLTEIFASGRLTSRVASHALLWLCPVAKSQESLPISSYVQEPLSGRITAKRSDRGQMLSSVQSSATVFVKPMKRFIGLNFSKPSRWFRALVSQKSEMKTCSLLPFLSLFFGTKNADIIQLSAFSLQPSS